MQVLTQEDWNTVMYDGMRATSKWAALYFILLMTIGNYILFNLLVAILVEGFATQPVRFNPPTFNVFPKKFSLESSSRALNVSLFQAIAELVEE